MAVVHYTAVDQEYTVLAGMNIHLQVDTHRAEEYKGKDKEDSPASPLMEVPESIMMKKLVLVWKIWRATLFLDLMVQVVELEDRDKTAYRMGKVYNKGTDKDTEEIHKVRMNQVERKWSK